MRIPQNHPDRHVCIIGMGYVGLTLAVSMADAGFRVHGIERSEHIQKCVRAGKAHFKETGLDDRLRTRVADGSLTISNDFKDARDSSVYIITVGTPLAPGTKETNLEAISDVAKSVSEVLSSGDIVILRSTVRVGVSREVVKPILDKALVAYDLAFCPERTLEGRALVELRTLPQIVGGATDAACLRATQLFNFLTPTTIKVRDLETAEMVKLVNNTHRDLQFGFANEVAHFCDAVGVSASEVIRAGNTGYPRGSMPMPGPVGGPCLEKDPYILAEGLAMRGGSAPLALSGRRTNEDLPRTIVEKLYKETDSLRNAPDCKIAILGLAFKGRPETSDLRGSLAIPLIQELQNLAPLARIFGYDPAVPAEEAVELGIEIASSPMEAFKDASLVIFQTNHPSFERLSLTDHAETMSDESVIYDLWNQFDPGELSLPNSTRYAGLGSWRLLDEKINISNSGTGGGFA